MECLSRSTQQRDCGPKRGLYRRWRIPNYWIVDRWDRVVTVVRPDAEDVTVGDSLIWHPDGAVAPLVIDLPALFREALDG